MNTLEKKLRKEYYNRKPKGFWFDYATMRHFDSVVDGKNYFEKNKEIYFITSEKNSNYARRWSIRKLDINGNVDTIGKFQQYETILKAEEAFKNLV